MKAIWMLIGAILSGIVSAQTVYTWEDESGVLHFSDTPDSNRAKALSLPDVQAVAPAPKFDSTSPVDPQPVEPLPTEAAAHKAPVRDKPDTPAPLELTLITPQHDQTLRSIVV